MVIHPNFFRLDGLLLFCIIMGLRSASSTIKNRRKIKIGINWYKNYPQMVLVKKERSKDVG